MNRRKSLPFGEKQLSRKIFQRMLLVSQQQTGGFTRGATKPTVMLLTFETAADKGFTH